MRRAFSSSSYWACQLSGWALYAALSAGLFFAMGGLKASGALSLLSSTLLSLTATHVHRAFVIRHAWAELSVARLAPRVLGSSVLLAIVTQALQVLLLLFVFHAFTWAEASSAVFAFVVVQIAILMLLWQVLYFGVHAIRRSRFAEVDRLSSLAAAQTAELRALRSQVNPHFLFNSLNTVRALIVEDAARAQEAVTRLSSLLRYALAAGEHQTVPLERELEMVNDYLALEALRFEERLTVVIDVAPDALRTQVPTMLLQTLVENAVKHGIARSAAGGELRVTARIDGAALALTVSNPTAPALDAERGSPGTGLGLANTTDRLRLLFGDAATFALSMTGSVTLAEVRIPCR